MGKLLPKPPKVLYPRALERQLLLIYLMVVEEVMEILSKKVLRVFHDSSRDKSIKGVIQKSEGALEGIKGTARAWDRAEWEKLRGKIALPHTVYAEPLQARLDKLVEDNIGLIKSLPERLTSRLEEKIKDIPKAGESRATVQKLLKETGDIGNRRAELIARDQIGKLNGDLTRLRQESLGGTMYIWRTSQDGRVREAHQALDGKICKWEDPTVYADTIKEAMDGEWKSRNEIGAYEGHTGEDYECRCTAEMVMDDILGIATGQGGDEEDSREGRENIKISRPKVPALRLIPEDRSGVVFSRSLKGLSPEEQDRIRALRAARKARKEGTPVQPVVRPVPVVRTEPVVRAEVPARYKETTRAIESYSRENKIKSSIDNLKYTTGEGFNKKVFVPDLDALERSRKVKDSLKTHVSRIFSEVHEIPKSSENLVLNFHRFKGATSGTYRKGFMEVKFTRHSEFVRQTFTHEFGHHLHYTMDHWGNNNVIEAIKETEYYKLLKQKMYELQPIFTEATGPNKRLYDYYEYLTNDKELFARSYSQYIWEKLGDSKMCTAAMRTGSGYYIKEESFAPIRKAFDEYFKNKGLSVTKG